LSLSISIFVWIPAPHFRGDEFTPAEAGAGMTEKESHPRASVLCLSSVIPAEAGIQSSGRAVANVMVRCHFCLDSRSPLSWGRVYPRGGGGGNDGKEGACPFWIPAFAGMTKKKSHPRAPSRHPRALFCHPRGGGDPVFWSGCSACHSPLSCPSGFPPPRE